MRNSFINTLVECAREDERVALLMAEVGFSVVEPFEKEFPNRFFNTGIAEQNLVTTAAGMAVAGMRPIAYSMSAFLASRAFEQIKVSVCYQNLPVILMSIGSGVSYGEMGSTHHAIEEATILRSLPNLKVEYPADGNELKDVIKYSLTQDSPFFISFPKMPDPKLPEHIYEFGKVVEYKNGHDITIFAVGSTTKDAVEASDILRKKGISAGVYSMHTVKPIDIAGIINASKTGNVYVVDEHQTCGGVGSEIAKILIENNIKINKFKEISINDCFVDNVSKYMELKEQYGLTSVKIASIVEQNWCI